ncbi:glycerophosphodiester phosphodiesterase family protein [Paenibacillus sediminis]|uniref:Glycerophosphoryl diester phosphodiesterase n=1 Tax=Paenibacillus sediminis TaxID=664909 RepID=A0ABS4H5H0_9BACL|nr:glycerophosphodiester phosphodiesterase family protein [Paenibacillus sediminis]MBP1937768.1 glycerophosphoryl diester phosphodiesterase [Paenibacillus sediminis]
MGNPCVAHRGYSAVAPENTLAAVRLAMTEPYVQWIEIDVQLSLDGIPVVIHDYTLNRTTNGRGRVGDYTCEELQNLDAGRWKGKAYAGEQIPTLMEVLQLVCGRLRVNIELKTKGDMYPGLEEIVVHCVRAHHMQHDVCITSFDVNSIRKAKRLAPEIATGLIVDYRPHDLIDQLVLEECSMLSIDYRHVDAKLLQQLRQYNMSTMAWTVNHSKDMIKLAEISPDILICTNDPDVWKETFLSNHAD